MVYLHKKKEEGILVKTQQVVHPVHITVLKIFLKGRERRKKNLHVTVCTHLFTQKSKMSEPLWCSGHL